MVLADYVGSPAMVDYSSTKGAIVSFTRALAGQLAPKGIRVNAVAPGPIYTPLQPASREAEEMEDWTVGGVPLRGRAGQPSEIVSGKRIGICDVTWFGSADRDGDCFCFLDHLGSQLCESSAKSF